MDATAAAMGPASSVAFSWGADTSARAGCDGVPPASQRGSATTEAIAKMMTD